MQSIALILKRAFWVIVLCLAIISFPLPSLAMRVQDVPNPQQISKGWVTDMANLLDSETKARLNQMLSQLEAENGTEIAVVTVPETSPAATPKQFATKLFKYWGIGKKGINNGVLFLISKSNRRVEIETGYGIEKSLPNARVSKIINQQIIPLFKQGNFADGTLAGIQALIKDLDGRDILPITSKHQLIVQVSKSQLIAQIKVAAVLSLWILVGGKVVSWIMIAFRRPTFVEPKGRSRTEDSDKNITLNCANCRQPMEKFDSESVLPHLSQPEQVAQKIGSVNFEGWRCPKCQPNLTGQGIHIRAYVLNRYRFKTCPTCQELTMEHLSKILEPATNETEGKRLVTEKCHCCSFVDERVEVVPRKSSDDSSSGDCGGGSWDSDDSSSWGGGDSGGFGGGDSGGGGDGGGW